MAHTDTRARRSVANIQSFGSALNAAAIVITAISQWRRTAATQAALADLTPDQLNDIGLPGAHRPVLEIKAGLMTNLMSMR
ncbi:hypothetical protein ASC97_11190 [Rhizobium sp. Root1203]|jgi:uncharacterized protein YjiS (DUF1127 family)|uniref:DUF1127 domain-containing protein n=1 Tax=Rhizobium sp. Root1203 TaxID=1736427 RepID=UPI0007093D1D|nr:DUF1127 domain-containing protein [Rhizobium sp. Root1203]KQV16334.1 hypothetical protein ASC97_11190 [Rhizobium sp. Root1203]